MLSTHAQIVRAMLSSIAFDYTPRFGKEDNQRQHTIGRRGWRADAGHGLRGRRADAGHGLRGGFELEDVAAPPALLSERRGGAAQRSGKDWQSEPWRRKGEKRRSERRSPNGNISNECGELHF